MFRSGIRCCICTGIHAIRIIDRTGQKQINIVKGTFAEINENICAGKFLLTFPVHVASAESVNTIIVRLDGGFFEG